MIKTLDVTISEEDFNTGQTEQDLIIKALQRKYLNHDVLVVGGDEGKYEIVSPDGSSEVVKVYASFA